MKILLKNFHPFRRKNPNENVQDVQSLNPRKYNFFELSTIGFGACLGFGVYILIGYIAKNLTGPSAIVSFAIAGFIAFFTACFLIEFIFSLPSNNGSIVRYIHATMGEFFAFIVGWNLILDYIIGAACVSRSFTLYLDSLVNGTLITKFEEVLPMAWDNVLGRYWDVIAFVFPILMAISLALGLKRHGIISMIVTILNCAFIFTLIVLMIVKADTNNWNIDSSLVLTAFSPGDGGFLPFTISSTIQASSLCIFVFIGFDALVSTINQPTFENNKKIVPVSFFIALIVIFIIYATCGIVMTLAWPYFQHSSGNWMAQFFDFYNWDSAKWIISLGALIAHLTSLFIFLHALTPLLQTMAERMMIFKWLGRNNDKWPRSPVAGILICGIIAGLIGSLFTIDTLIKMLAFGTIITFLCISVGIVILRHSQSNPDNLKTSTCDAIIQLFNCRCKRIPTQLSSKIVNWMLFVYCLATIALTVTLRTSYVDVFAGEIWAVSLAGGFLLIMGIILLSIIVQPGQPKDDIYFRLPILSIFAGISIFLNIYLLTYLEIACWIRFGIWMAIGLAIYFYCVYVRDCGIRNVSVIVNHITHNTNHVEKANSTLNLENETVVENGITERPVVFLVSEKSEVQKSAITPKPRKLKDRVAPTPPSNKKVQNDAEIIGIFKDPISEKQTREQKVVHIATPVILPLVMEEVRQEKSVVMEDKMEIAEITEIAQITAVTPEDPIPPPSKFKDDTDTKSALDMLDNVILNEEKRPPSVAFNADFDLDKKIKELEEKQVPSMEIDPTPNIEVVTEIEVQKKEEPELTSNNDEIPATETKARTTLVPLKGSRKSDSNKDFKRHLTLLLLDKNKTEKRPKTGQINGLEQPLEFPPPLKHSKSESNIRSMVLHDIRSIGKLNNDQNNENNDNVSSSSQEGIKTGEMVKIPEPPKFDAELFESVGKIVKDNAETTDPIKIPEPPVFDANLFNSMGKAVPLVPLNNKGDLEDSVQKQQKQEAVPIPEPPKFDPVLYNKSPKGTLKSHRLSVASPKPDQRSLIRPKTDDTKAQINVPENTGDALDRGALKQRLEMIFQKGPPSKAFGFKPHTPVKRENSPEKDENENDVEQDDTMVELRPVEKPFNTAKLRFSEVLKSIKEDRRPSITRTNLFQSSQNLHNGGKSLT